MHYFTPKVWEHLTTCQAPIWAIESPMVERLYLLSNLLEWDNPEAFSLYFWDLGCGQNLLKVLPGKPLPLLETDQQTNIPTNPQAQVGFAELLNWWVSPEKEGILVVEGMINALKDNLPLQQQLATTHFQLRQRSPRKFLVLVEERLFIPLALHPLIRQFQFPLPSKSAIRDKVARYFWEEYALEQSEENLAQQAVVVQACVGLPHSEIDIVLNWTAKVIGELDFPKLAEAILSYKQQKLKDRGITVLPQPDVEVAAGMDRLDQSLEQIRMLLTPEAEKRGLTPPKSVLLWGIPGTGKSLAAKLAAKRIGGILIAADWGSLIGKTIHESLANLDYLFSFLQRVGTSILFFDEFDKAFTGWDESGQTGKLAAKLLTWMNDHTEPCVMFATINHLGMLPPEMIRRFEIIHFFGMPHNGALQAVFTVHLEKYFNYHFSLDEWHYLLREYRGCTPAEVMKAVKAVANRRFFRDLQAHQPISAEKPELSLAELLEERNNFTPDAEKREISDTIAGILNKADYAIPVQGEDTSIFAEPPHTLMGIDEEKIKQELSQLTSPAEEQQQQNHSPLLNRPRPPIEDI